MQNIFLNKEIVFFLPDFLFRPALGDGEDFDFFSVKLPSNFFAGGELERKIFTLLIFFHSFWFK